MKSDLRFERPPSSSCISRQTDCHAGIFQHWCDPQGAPVLNNICITVTVRIAHLFYLIGGGSRQVVLHILPTKIILNKDDITAQTPQPGISQASMGSKQKEKHFYLFLSLSCHDTISATREHKSRIGVILVQKCHMI